MNLRDHILATDDSAYGPSFATMWEDSGFCAQLKRDLEPLVGPARTWRSALRRLAADARRTVRFIASVVGRIFAQAVGQLTRNYWRHRGAAPTSTRHRLAAPGQSGARPRSRLVVLSAPPVGPPPVARQPRVLAAIR